MKTCKSLIFGLTLIALFVFIGGTVSNAYSGTIILQKSSANIHKFTGLPLTEDGWTDFQYMIRGQNFYQDARVIFVSSSEGNNATGEIYGVDAITFDTNGLFQPAAPVNAFQTISAAYANIRDGYPDILLLERDNEWEEQFTPVSAGRIKSGKSITERHIIASYGTGARPTILTGSSLGGIDGYAAKHIVVAGIRVYANLWESVWGQGIGDGTGTGRGIRIGGGGAKNHLYEDCVIERQDYSVVQGGSTPPSFLENIAFRRTIYKRPWHSGIYASGVMGLLLEENIFHKPWRESLNRWGRHLYLSPAGNEDSSTLRGVLIKRNIFHIAERGGAEARSGAVIDNNLFIASSTRLGGAGGSAGSLQSGHYTNNVGVEFSPIEGSSSGMSLNNMVDSSVINNIWTDNTNVASSATPINLRGGDGDIYVAKNIEISNNVIYGYNDGSSSSRGISCWAPSGTEWDAENITITNNEIQMIHGSGALMYTVQAPLEVMHFSGNHYYSTIPEKDWFYIGGTLAGWVAESGETGAQAGLIAYPYPDRTVKTYNQSLGGSADTDAFIEDALQQSRHNWRPEYTACAVNNYIRQGFGKDSVDCAVN